MEHSNGIIQWNIQFSRLMHDWEVEVLVSFYKCLYDCMLRGVGVDKLWWLHSCKGLFEVRLLSSSFALKVFFVPLEEHLEI
jgi:hypothetical protein